MTEKTHELIQSAAQVLRVTDIVLYSSRLDRPSPMPTDDDFEVVQQHRRNTRYGLVNSFSDETSYESDLVVLVELGARLVGSESDESEDPPVYVEIEAEFLVEYAMSASLDDSAIKAFARHNSVHNVWPFWRQHVFDIVQRGRLPSVEIPLFSIKEI